MYEGVGLWAEGWIRVRVRRETNRTRATRRGVGRATLPTIRSVWLVGYVGDKMKMKRKGKRKWSVLLFLLLLLLLMLGGFEERQEIEAV